jgi:phytoene dehydrogenase-like protein
VKTRASLPVAVLGAGAAGLSASLELLAGGSAVHLFEAHSLPGGSASWFRRSTSVGALQFDVGATVLDGLDSQAWLGKRFAKWGVDLAPFERMPAMHYKLSSETPAFELDTRSPEAWIQSLARAFPKDTHFILHDLAQLARLAKQLKSFVEGRPHFPIQNFGDLARDLRLVPHLPGLISSVLASGDFDFGTWLSKRSISPELRRWLEMSLLITVQDSPEAVFTPWAALALSFYPLGAGTLPGGMRGLMEAALRRVLASPNASVSLKHKVTGLARKKTGFFIQTLDRNETLRVWGPFRSVVSSLSRFDTARIAPEGTFAPRDAWSRHEASLWGASTAYVCVEDLSHWSDAAFNLHSRLDPHRGGSEGNDAYLSFSKRGDLERAPVGFRVATLSTHTHLGPWKDLSTLNYAAHKEAAGEQLLKHFRVWAPTSKIVHQEFGSPRTFLRYTGRLHGHVGGLPMNRDNTLLSPPAQRTRLHGLYQIGDTSFPGQSVYACALGAIVAVEKLWAET